MQQRIDHLEGLVKTMMSQGQETSHSEDSALPQKKLGSSEDVRPRNGSHISSEMKDASAATSNADITVTNRGQSVYKATKDWSDVLQEVNELKKVWNQGQDDPTDSDIRETFSNMVDGSSLLSGQLKPVAISELLALLPPKMEVDLMVYQFFDRENFPIPIAPILHKPTFMREYAEHWRDPARTSAIWLGLLFSILGITMLSYHQFNNEPPEYKGSTEELFEFYRLLTAQCLMIGDIAKCLPYTLETLLLNSTAELNRKDDSGRGLWMMTGVIVRAAINMGYHRELSQTSSISVLQREMRRRIWLTIETKEKLASFLVGFPSMTLGIYSDILEPRNLHDWELSDTTTVFPPSRPLDETTPVNYLIIKGRLVRALDRVNDINNDLRPESYDTVLEIDKSLYETFQSVLAFVKKDVGNPDSDSSQSKSPTSVSTMQMEFLYHRGMCVLHRKFVAKARADGKYSLSRDRCISSSLAILAHQRSFHKQTRSKTPSYVPAWYTIAQARQFFALAAMILFLDLEHRRRGRGTNMEVKTDSDVILHALEKSCAIWREVQNTSEEAWKVYHLLDSMLVDFETALGTAASQNHTLELASITPESDQPIHITNDNIFVEEDLFEKPNEMDIDWTTWDSFIEGASFEDAYQGILLNDTDLNSTAL